MMIHKEHSSQIILSVSFLIYKRFLQQTRGNIKKNCGKGEVWLALALGKMWFLLLKNVVTDSLWRIQNQLKSIIDDMRRQPL